MRMSELVWDLEYYPNPNRVADFAYVEHSETGERWKVLSFNEGKYRMRPDPPMKGNITTSVRMQAIANRAEDHDAVSLALRLLDFNPLRGVLS